MKTKDELNALKKEVEAMDKKLSELNDDELKIVIGGLRDDLPKINPDERYIMKTEAPLGTDLRFEKPTGPDQQYEINIYKNTIDKNRPG